MNDHNKRLQFRELLKASDGIIAPSAPDPMFARLVEDCGYRLLHLAGNGMHRSRVLPDCSMVTMTEMAERATSIAEVLTIPMLVDGETGYGGPLQTARAVRAFERAGVAGIRFEDSMFGQNGIDAERPTVTVAEMVDKIKAMADARSDAAMILAVRCDARAAESREQVLERIDAYVSAGIDAIGVHLSDAEEHRWFGANVAVPLIESMATGRYQHAGGIFRPRLQSSVGNFERLDGRAGGGTHHARGIKKQRRPRRLLYPRRRLRRGAGLVSRPRLSRYQTF